MTKIDEAWLEETHGMAETSEPPGWETERLMQAVAEIRRLRAENERLRIMAEEYMRPEQIDEVPR